MGTKGVVGQPDILPDEFADVGRQEFILLTARYHQDVLNDADGTFAMLSNLLEVFLQVGHDVFCLLMVVL